MKRPNYRVEVPAYIILSLAAPTPEIAAEAAEDYIKDALAGRPMKINWPVNGLTIETQSIELLGPSEDRTPDVYETRRGVEVLVNGPESGKR